MANIEGNRIALDDVLGTMFPKAPRGLVQGKVNSGAFYTRTYAANDGETTWDLIDAPGYEVAVLAGDNERGPFYAPGYLRFGVAGSTTLEGAVPVFPGARIEVPQSFTKVWFKPGSGPAWRIVISKLPHVRADYGPGTNLPVAVQLVEPVYTWIASASMPTADPVASDGTTPADALASCEGFNQVTLHFLKTVNGRLVAADGDKSYDVWWLTLAGTWAHNPGDDCDAAGRGVINSTHDCEVYDIPRGIVGVYVKPQGEYQCGVAIITGEG